MSSAEYERKTGLKEQDNTEIIESVEPEPYSMQIINVVGSVDITGSLVESMKTIKSEGGTALKGQDVMESVKAVEFKESVASQGGADWER